MLNLVKIQNFKSIRTAEIRLPRIAIFLGHNNSGKSSVFQALGIMKNFALNPNRSLDEILNLGYLRLGNQTDVAWRHHQNSKIGISIRFSVPPFVGDLGLEIGPHNSSALSILSPFHSEVSVEFTLPYARSSTARSQAIVGGKSGAIIWDGVTLRLEPGELASDPLLRDLPGAQYDSILSFFIVPTAAAFQSNLYPTAGIPDPKTLLTIPDNVIASIFQQDADLEEKVSHHVEKIFDVKSVRSRVVYPSSSLIVGRTKFASNLINEGFGLNRTVLMLANLLVTPSNSVIAIEEPESHLHPAAQVKLARSLIELLRDENKQLIISTHSEHLLIGFLAGVSQGLLKPEDLAVYFTEMNIAEMETSFTAAVINERGQIKGGLQGFFETDLVALAEATASLGASNANSG